MSVDIVDRLRQFTPYYMLSSLGFAMGDERDEDGCKIFFANVPKEWGRGSLDMAMFGGQHLPLSICSQAADRIEKLETAFREMPCVDIEFNSEKERDDWRAWTAKYFDAEGQLK